MTEQQFAPIETLNYGKAMAELEQILRMMQSDQCDIDRLTAYTRRATELIAFCRNRLTATDAELRAILDDMSAS